MRHFAAQTSSRADAGPDLDVGPFVLNLVKLRAPLALAEPHMRLRGRCVFFIGCDEEGAGYQYWLRLGHFATRSEAQSWLTILRRDYPMASISPAYMTLVAGDDVDQAAVPDDLVTELMESLP
jgi:hypothetical protein